MKPQRIFVAFAASWLLCAVGTAQAPPPKSGFVPDARTACRIAEAVLAPIYGEKQIASERPFYADLIGGVWTVQGSLPSGWDGGVATIRIRKSDGAIVSYIHGK